jgi:hypothetical protein
VLTLADAVCACCLLLQGVHNQWSEPSSFRPERFMPDGEFDQFEENVRPYMFVPFIQVRYTIHCDSGYMLLFLCD